MLQLVPFEKRHIQGFIKWNRNEDEVARFAGTGFTYPVTEEQVGDFPKKINAIAFGLEDEQGRHIGNGDFVLDQENKEARLCRLIIDPDHRGKGYGQQMVKLLIQEARQLEPSYRISLFVLHDNPAAIAAYKACGFEMSEQAFSFEVNGIVYSGFKMYYHES